MYQNIHISKQNNKLKVHLWDDTVGYKTFDYKSYAYMKHGAGTYRSLYGDKLKKVNYWTAEDMPNMFESDVPIPTRVLVDQYPESDEMSKGHREMIIDIEVEVTEGFPNIHTADNKITAIAIYDRVTDKYSCFVLGNVPKTDVVESFKSEEELLQKFYQKYLEINPTIITGWNTDFFDIPYLYNRTQRVLGKQIANTLSPIGDVHWIESKKRYKIAGVSSLDYLGLYRLFNYSEKSSYRLDVIGTDEVGIGKIEYEGTLQDLYENDINKYVEYNLNDVVIVKALDDKLKFIDLARSIAHKGHVPYEDVYHSSRYLEGAILVYLKDLGVVAPNKPNNGGYNRTDEERFSGAYVKDPKPGRYEWVFDLDLTSMYPSTIMTLNISPEMKIGKIVGWNAEEFMKGTEKTYTIEIGKKTKTYSNIELKNMFDDNHISISSNGILYRNDKKGLIPSLLERWFDERVEFKRLMKKHGNAGETAKYEYFHKRQLVQKILLNSMYGVLGSPIFRFYDIDNAEATTLTGQTLIKFTEKIANHYYNTELGDKKDYCIYTDTDSVFYPATPLVKNRYPDADLNDDKFMTEQILLVAKEVEDYINNSYDYFALKFLNVKKGHRFDIKQECIAKAGFWVTKKRYGQWIINDGGVTCDKLDVKGLDIVRSNFPPAMRVLMKGVLQDILSHKDKQIIDDQILEFKDEMKKMDLTEIALPTGVKQLKKFITKGKNESVFTRMNKGTPVHVKSAIIYNDLLTYFNEKGTGPISNGEKIKWVYLKDNPLKCVSAGFKGYDDPQKVMEFIHHYVDYDKLFERALKKKISMFYDALNWNFPVKEENTLTRFF